MADTDDPKNTITPDIVQTSEQPMDVKEEPVLPPPPEPATTIVQRRNGVPALIGGAVAAVFGFGLAQVVPDGWPLQSTDAIAAEVAALKAEVTTLQGRLAEMSEPDVTLADRVAALESAPAAAAPDLAPLADRVAALEAQPAPIAAEPGSGVNVATSVLAAQAEAIAALQADVAALKEGGAISPDIEARLAKAEERATALAAQTEADAAAARLRTALDRLEIALESGAPFAAALADLDDTEVRAVLADNAANGLPTLPALQSEFPEAARTALGDALRASAGDTWTDRAAAFLRSQTGARSLTPREGTDPDAVLSRAEAALAAGDIPTTLAEVSALPAEGQAALADWVARANTYLAAQQAVADLRTALKVE